MLNSTGYQHRYSNVPSQSDVNSKPVVYDSAEEPSILASTLRGQIRPHSPMNSQKQQQHQQHQIRIIPQRDRMSQQHQPYPDTQHQESRIYPHLQQGHHTSFTYDRLPIAPIVPSTSANAPSYYTHYRYSNSQGVAHVQPPHHQQQQQQHHHTPPRPHQRQKSVGTSSNAETTSGRPYRSRKDRPCDSCRKRKSRCIIEESGQDCQSCRMNGRDCTFEMSPTPRSRPVKNEDGVTISSVIVPRKRSYSSQKGDSLSPADSAQNANMSHTTSATSDESQRRPRYNSNLDQKAVRYPRQKSIGSADAEPIANNTEKSLSSTGIQGQVRNPGSSIGILTSLIASPSEPSASSITQISTPQMENRTTKDRNEENMSKSTTSSGTLYDLVSAVMFKDDVNPIPDIVEGDHSLARNEIEEPLEEQENEKEMTTVVLGSSASEDPQLLRQAGSPGSAQLPNNGVSNANDSLQSSSKPTIMPPPPTPDLHAASSGSNPAQNPTSSPKSYPLQVRQMNGDPYNPVFFAFVPAHPYGRSSNKTCSQLGAPGYTKLKEAIHSRMGRLMVWYSQRDSAAFPLLFEGQRRKFRQAAVEALKPNSNVDVPLPLVLATATLATATVYDVSLRPISKEAWGNNLHALMQQFEHSTLTTIQVALTDLTGRPSINTSGNIMTFNQTLAISHTLGLHLDPTNWTIPNEEKDVRIRLWWATMIHDKWSSLCWGRPSTIHAQDYTVPLPRKNGFSPCSEHLEDTDLKRYTFGTGWQTNETSHTPGETYSGLCRLTLILSEILGEFHSVRGVHVMHRNSFTVSQKVKTYLVQLEDWMDLLPPTLKSVLKGDNGNIKGSQYIPGTRSLHLSYLGVILLLCRTLLDSVTTKGTQESERHVPAHKTSLHGCLMMIEYLESLDHNDYAGFFLHYGSHHIASCLSLLARLCYGFARLNEDDLLHTSITCMSRLLVTLSDAHRLYKWDLAELALTRSRAILPAMKASIPQWTKVFGDSLLPEDGDINRANEAYIEHNDDRHSTKVANTSERVSGNGNQSKVLLSNEEVFANKGEEGSGKEMNNVHKDASQNGGLIGVLQSSRPNVRLGGVMGVPGMGVGSNNHNAIGLGTAMNENGAGNNLHPYMGSGPYASIPIDAAGLPYPIGMNNSGIGGVPSGGAMSSPATGNGTTGASHLLSSMEVDWLALGLEPNTYSEYFVNSSFINHLGNPSGNSDTIPMGNDNRM